MNITFENPDKVNGQLTVTIEKEDYQDKVEKTLKDYRKRAQVPGFRTGMVPMGMIKKQYGMAVKMEEVNRLLSEKVTSYINENKIQVLGQPLASEHQEPADLAQDGPFTFKFDIAVAPEFTIELTNNDKLTYYAIKADDKMVDQQVQMYCQQFGEMKDADVFSGNDTLTGDLRQLDDHGNTLEGGITVDSSQLMPAYIKEEDQKKLFDGCKPGDIITFNPKKAYPDNDAEIAALLKLKKEEVKDLTSDFSYQVTGIRHFQPAEVGQTLFDKVFGEGVVSNEKDFRKKASEMIESQLAQNSDYKFMEDLRAYCEDKVGELTFPEELLKRFMKQQDKEKDKSDEEFEKDFQSSLRELKWHLIKEQLVSAQGIKVEDGEVKSLAQTQVRQQFVQYYGINDMPEDVIEKYADEMLTKRENVERLVDIIVSQKLLQNCKTVVKLSEKSVTFDEFNKLVKEA